MQGPDGVPHPAPPTYDDLPCGVLILSADFRILSANTYFTNLVNDPAMDRRLHDYLSVAGRIFLQTRLQQELALSGRVEELALDLIHPSGRRIPVMLNATQALGEDGLPGLIRMALWRAIAKRAYEAEVPRARLAAEAGAAVKRDFLANISHEIRTPLNGVIGIAGALRSTPLADEQVAMVDMIVSSGTILERLVSDILDLSKAQSGGLSLELRAVDLTSELQGIVHTARLAAEGKGLAFTVRWADGLRAHRVCDSVRVRQVVGNLLSNAVKFTADGGVTLDVLEDGDALMFVVEDSGIGFDDAVGDTLFQRFQQADASITRRYGGSGLGLAICKALVEQMDGSIKVDSRPGRGSRFSVRLPLAQTPEGPGIGLSGEVGGDPASLAPLRILLVEDNTTNQMVVRMILAATDVDLTVVDDGRQGVEAWDRQDWDLILMDMQMPVMDGLTALRLIRAGETSSARARTPVAVLSANAMAHHRQEALDAGADFHMAKPITPSLLLTGIAEALDHASHHEAQKLVTDAAPAARAPAG